MLGCQFFLEGMVEHWRAPQSDCEVEGGGVEGGECSPRFIHPCVAWGEGDDMRVMMVRSNHITRKLDLTMIVLQDLKLNHKNQALTRNNMRKAPLLLARSPQLHRATPHTAAVKRLRSMCRVYGRH